MNNFYKNKKILVTGGVGSIGNRLVKQLLKYDPGVIRVLDINETGLFNLAQDLKTKKIRCLIGDVRDRDRLKRAVEDIDIIFHAAALKHVSLCEVNPFEAIQTNVLGTRNLIEVALGEEVSKFVFISTDKAVNPTNVLGASKLLAEKLTISSNLYKGSRKTDFSCVRFGNVLNSQGSVLPIFEEQIKSGGTIYVTDPGMTRFIMTIERAIELVLKTAYMSRGGVIFIIKMPSLYLKDLAQAAIEEIAPKYGYNPGEIKIKFIGKREGEKVHEELMTEDEASLACETEDMFILLPSFNYDILSSYYDKGGRKNKIEAYKSNIGKLLTVGDTRRLLKKVLSSSEHD